jgi:hypothetical protein
MSDDVRMVIPRTSRIAAVLVRVLLVAVPVAGALVVLAPFVNELSILGLIFLVFVWLPFGATLLARRAGLVTQAVAVGAGLLGLVAMAYTDRQFASDEIGGTEYMQSVFAVYLLAGAAFLLNITIIGVRQAMERRRVATPAAGVYDDAAS